MALVIAGHENSCEGDGVETLPMGRKPALAEVCRSGPSIADPRTSDRQILATSRFSNSERIRVLSDGDDAARDNRVKPERPGALNQRVAVGTWIQPDLGDPFSG